jgi:hypothetical protein
MHQALIQTDKTATETHKMLKYTFGEEPGSRIKKYISFPQFKNGVTSVTDAEHTGCPSTTKMDENGVNQKTCSQTQIYHYP